MDLISRQAAIDAVRGYLVGKRCPDDGTLTCRLIENEVINKLHTIHPEHGTNLAEVGTDCISRQMAIDALRKMQTYKLFSGDDMLLIDQAGAMTELMMLPPSAQPEHIKGKWLPYKYAMPGKEYKFHVCSVCGVCDEYVVDVPRPNGTIARLESVRNFCPNCGAKMEVTK